MTCLVTMYRVHLNSTDHRDSCYVIWFRASLCKTTSRWADPDTIVPNTSIQNCLRVFTISNIITQIKADMRARMLGARVRVVQKGNGWAHVFLLTRASWAEPNGSVYCFPHKLTAPVFCVWQCLIMLFTSSSALRGWVSQCKMKPSFIVPSLVANPLFVLFMYCHFFGQWVQPFSIFIMMSLTLVVLLYFCTF